MRRKKWKKPQRKEVDALKGHFFMQTIYDKEKMRMLVIDLERAKYTLNETWSEMLGSWTKTLLKYMYGKDVKMVANLNEENKTKFSIKGQYKDVKAYAKAVAAQKEFLDAYIEFGTEHPQTEKKRTELRADVQHFESVTGLQWPFRDED